MLKSEARSRVLSLLDDVDATRWTSGTSTTQLNATKDVDIALAVAAEECVSQYAGGGGERLDTVKEFTTDSNGVVFLTHYPVVIKNVSVRSGTSSYPIRAARMSESQNPVGVGDLIHVRAVYGQDMFVAGTTAFSYAGDSDLAWDVMDAWICTVAAKHLLPKDAEPNNQLDERIGMLREAAIREPETPMSIEFPRNDRFNFYTDYRWSFVASYGPTSTLNSLQIHRI